MTWNRATAAGAVAAALDAVDPQVVVFSSPPTTFNPPAFIVGYPRTVRYDSTTFGVDEAELPVMGAVGPTELDRLDALLEQAKKTLNADPTAGGAVFSLRVSTQESWRMLNVAGADILVADLICVIRM